MEPIIVTTRKSITQQLDSYFEDAKNRSFFVGGATIIFIIFFLVVGIIPAYSQVKEQIEINDKLDLVIKSVEEKTIALTSLTQELEAKKTVVDYLDEAFPTGPSQENLIIQFLSLANSLNLKVDSLSFGKPATTESISTIFPGASPSVSQYKLQFSLEGDKVKLLSFLNFLENSRRLYNIESLALGRVSVFDQDNQEIVSANNFSIKVSLQVIYINQVPVI